MTVRQSAPRRTTQRARGGRHLLSTRALLLILSAAAVGVVAVIQPAVGAGLAAGLAALAALHSLVGK